MRSFGFRRGELLSLALMTVSAGCGGKDLPVDATPDQVIEHVEKQLEGHDYFDAAELLEHFLRTHPGTSLTPLAKLRLGDARYGLEEYVLAQGEYEDLVTGYPGSPLVEEARFKIAMCSYSLAFPYDRDQTETEKAVRLLGDFRRDFPQSRFLAEADSATADCRERLAHREFEAGRFYRKQDRLRSAKLQFEHVVNRYPESPWAPKAALEIGDVYRVREKWDLAARWFETVAERWPDSREAKLAQRALRSLPAGVAQR
jgi:outer membrane protein assembly factor BamD